MFKKIGCQNKYIDSKLHQDTKLMYNKYRCVQRCVQDILCGAINFLPETSQCILLNPDHNLDCTIMTQSLNAVYLEKVECRHGSIRHAVSRRCLCVNGFVGPRCERLMIDCREGRQWLYNGVYEIQPIASTMKFDVVCQNGKTIIQRRSDGLESFNRSWEEYKAGFGSLENGDFWLGFSKLNLLFKNTQNSGKYSLINVALLENGTRVKSTVTNLELGDESTGYQLGFNKVLINNNNTLGDCFSPLKGHKFSTIDNDRSTNQCTQTYQSGWWFGPNCSECNPNGAFDPVKRIRLKVDYEWFWTDELEASIPLQFEMRLRYTEYK